MRAASLTGRPQNSPGSGPVPRSCTSSPPTLRHSPDKSVGTPLPKPPCAKAAGARHALSRSKQTAILNRVTLVMCTSVDNFAGTCAPGLPVGRPSYFYEADPIAPLASSRIPDDFDVVADLETVFRRHALLRKLPGSRTLDGPSLQNPVVVLGLDEKERMR